jgi:hypothetical protein
MFWLLYAIVAGIVAMIGMVIAALDMVAGHRPTVALWAVFAAVCWPVYLGWLVFVACCVLREWAEHRREKWFW